MAKRRKFSFTAEDMEGARTGGYDAGRHDGANAERVAANTRGVAHAVNVNSTLQGIVADLTALIRANSPMAEARAAKGGK